MNVTGTPTLALNSGGSASYASGSGTNTLTFNYTVGAGETSADLDYSATSSLALSGGTIKDAATNNATLTLPAVGGGSSLGGQKAIVVDTTNPTASVTTPAGNGNTYNASSLPGNLAGSSADPSGSGVSTVGIAIRDGAGNYWGGATFNQGSIFYNATGGTVGAWTYSTGTLVGQLTDGHTYTITARSTDAAGNTGTAPAPSSTTPPAPPSPTSRRATRTGRTPTGEVIHVQVAFGEAVTVTGTPQLTLNTTPSRTADYASGSGTSTLEFDYTVQAGDASADLDYAATSSLALNGGTIKDAATNTASLTLPTVGGASSIGGQKNIVVDTAAPTVSSVSASNSNGAYKAGDTIHVLVTFSKTVTVAGGTPSIALNTTPSRSATYASGSGERNADLRLHRPGGRHLCAARCRGGERALAQRRDDPRHRGERRGHHGRHGQRARRRPCQRQEHRRRHDGADGQRRHVVDRERRLQGRRDGLDPGQLQRERHRHRHPAARLSSGATVDYSSGSGTVDPDVRLHRRRPETPRRTSTTPAPAR